MKKLKLGIIGTGIATNDLYWPELKKLRSKIEIVAVANRRKHKALAFAKKAGVKVVCENGEELLKRKDVEAVVVSLPIELNSKWVLKALRAGKHVLCEKPIAANAAEGRRLVKAAAKFRPSLMVGENYFFEPHVQKAVAWLRQGRLGRPQLVEAVQLSLTKASNKYYKTAWRQKPRYIGGFIVDAGVHVSNIVREMFGMPVEVKPFSSQFNPLLKPIDTAVASLRFKNGTLGLWKACFTALNHSDEPRVRVYGSKANLDVYNDRSVLIAHSGMRQTFRSRQTGFYHEFAHFADSVLKGRRPEFKPSQALADLEFMELIVK